MRKLRIGVYIITILAVVLGCYGLLSEDKQTRAGNLVVVLDAGHDDSHTGAAGNGLYEESLNLQIALACKNELETYEGVTVYMVRDTGTCPYGGQSMGSSTACNKKRVEYAKGVGADVYVSLHNNSSTNSSAKGASVYYPTTNYNYHCGVTGNGLARSILDQLLTIGLQDRGISVRYSEDNSRYPDGSLADYYGVIKNSKLQGIPAIIVEHAFVSNAQDAKNYLSTYEKLWNLGVLDATGIAKYYGLKKKIQLDYSKAVVESYTADNREVCIRITDVIGAESVQFAVWSREGGKNDLKTYSAKSNGKGAWSAFIPISNHGSEGEYLVEVFANGTVSIGNTTFEVKGPSVQGVNIAQTDLQKGTFVVEVEKAFSGTEIDSVSAAVFNKAAPGNVKWIQGTALGAGMYEIPVSIRDFNYEYGTYQIQTYVRDKNAIVKCVDTQSYTIECPTTELEVTGVALSAAYEVRAEKVPYGNGITEMTLRLYPVTASEVAVVPEVPTSDAVLPGVSGDAVMPEEDGVFIPEITKEAVASNVITPEVVTGASNLIYIASGPTVEFKASKKQLGSWSGYVYPAKIGVPGLYKVEVYGKVSGNKEVLLGEIVFEAFSKKQTLKGVIDENGQTVWTGNGLSVFSKSMEKDFLIEVNPWCDYASIGKVLNQKTGFFHDYVAYEIKKETAGQVQLVFDIPQSLQGKEIRVLRFVPGDIKEPEVLVTTLSEDNQKVSVNATSDGIFVIVAKEENLWGDADLNNLVELRDAQLVLRAALGIDKLSSNIASYCDVDNSGVIDLADAQLILKYALGIIDVL